MIYVKDMRELRLIHVEVIHIYFIFTLVLKRTITFDKTCVIYLIFSKVVTL